MKKYNDIFFQLKTKLKEDGAECSIISARHLRELESDYNLMLTDSQIDRLFVKKYLENYIDFAYLKNYPSINSIIIIATPSPEIEVNFNYEKAIYSLKIPPHYSDRIKVTGNIKNITSQIFESNGYHTFSVVLPKKLIAVHSGLATYGKNNICYVPGMGSYHRLTVFATDLPCVHDSWRDLQMLDRCNNCRACQNNCPTGAIVPERFSIKAERCLTYFNEQLNPFPDWLNSSWHNSIIGCMKCQNICPENKAYQSPGIYKDGFSESETNLILAEMPFEELPEKLQLKIKNLSLKPYYKRLSRNIKVLIEKKLN
jgi:epoxyqueuosine reductase